MNTLHEIRIKNANRLLIGHLNVNSFRSKFEMLEELIKDKIDILLISETKLDRNTNYKYFDNNNFRGELIRELSSNNIQSDDLTRFTNISKMILEKKAPLKERYVRYNQAKFMNKILQKAIMNRSRLLNKYRKEKTEATRSAYKREKFLRETIKKDQKRVLQ